MDAFTLRAFAAIWPEILLTASIIAVIIMGLLAEDRKEVVYPALIGIVGACVIEASLFFFPSTPLFSGMIALDPFGVFFKTVFLAAAFLVVLFSLDSREVAKSISPDEYYAALLGTALGMCLLASSLNLLMIYLSLEVVSLTSYVLTASMRENRRSSEAGLKYSLYGALASGVMIYGMSLLYGYAGSLDLIAISLKLRAVDTPPLLLTLSLLFVLVGFGFKISMVPFHMWAPDVYEGAPTPITAFLSVGPKAAGFAVLIRFLYTAAARHGAQEGQWLMTSGVDWADAVAWLSVLTMTVGNLAAIAQTNMKRLLAYSSIAQAGYMLLGVVTLSSQGLSAVLFYVGVYLFMNLGAFLVVLVVENRLNTEQMEDYRGLGVRAPLLAGAMTVFLFALTGIPPLSGFIGKVLLFGALIKEELYWLAVVGVLNSVISLYYYSAIIKKMYLEEAPANPSPEANPATGPVPLTLLERCLLLALLVPTILFGLWPTPLMKLSEFALSLITL